MRMEKYADATLCRVIDQCRDTEFGTMYNSKPLEGLRRRRDDLMGTLKRPLLLLCGGREWRREEARHMSFM